MAKTKPVVLSPLAKRVERLVNEVAFGGHRRFAAMIGISQAAISNILAGNVQPGSKTLHLIGLLPNINADWLRTGGGEPFLDPDKKHREKLDRQTLRLNIAAGFIANMIDGPVVLSNIRTQRDDGVYRSVVLDALFVADRLITAAESFDHR